jgi:hypothetical protein
MLGATGPYVKRLDHTIRRLRAAFSFPGVTVTIQHDMQAEIAENEQRIAVHEAVCAERYNGILQSFSRGERRMERIEKKSQRIEWMLYFVVLVVIGGKDVALKIFEFFIK